MSGSYDEIVGIILSGVGGRDNVTSFTHCITRLHFKLKDISKANIDLLKKTDCIFKVIEGEGQLQLAVGSNVNVREVYKAVCNEGQFNEECTPGLLLNKLGIRTALVDRISRIFSQGSPPIQEKKKATKKDDEWEVVIDSPLTGEVKELRESEDEVFASGALGYGVAILPKEGKVVAPCDGVISSFFPTGHAIGITSDSGAEILIHIGMNTVNLGGKYFTPKAKEGDRIKNKQLLMEFDADGIKGAGYSLVSPVIITNPEAYNQIIFETGRHITRSSPLFTLIYSQC
ncbi:MAG: glucose PTS transporter subunit IIA [Acetivibrionales bacterium]|jgi:glucose-specific phosphotransferase system IIA component